jgi:hypothetical protein
MIQHVKELNTKLSVEILGDPPDTIVLENPRIEI